jgi:hypothetical protein
MEEQTTKARASVIARKDSGEWQFKGKQEPVEMSKERLRELLYSIERARMCGLEMVRKVYIQNIMDWYEWLAGYSMGLNERSSRPPGYDSRSVVESDMIKNRKGFEFNVINTD